MTFRSPRLEELLSVPFEEITEDHLQRLVDGAVPEDSDLDFKAEVYGRTDQAKRDLAGDVAGPANTLGGVVIIGIGEDGSGRATTLQPLEVPPDEVVRIRQVVATNVAPVPAIEIREIPSTAQAGRSYLLIGVPLSPDRPHGVRVGDGFRFPVRDGPRIRYLSEPELADLYRSRFRGLETQVERLDAVESEGIENLADRRVWLMLSVVPRTPGMLRIDRSMVVSVRDWAGAAATLGIPHPSFFSSHPTANTRVQRIALSSAYEADVATEQYLEMHADGSIYIASAVSREGWPTDDYRAAYDEYLVLTLLQMLALAGRFAAELAHSGGDALARANLIDVTEGVPNEGISLVHFRGFTQTVQVWPGARPLKSQLRLTHSINLDVLSDRRDLLITARMLLTEIFQGCGVAEVPQLTQEGAIRRKYFANDRQQGLRRWAEDAGIEVTEEQLS